MNATLVPHNNLTENTIRDEADVLNILVATDIHLGFEEKDPIRDEDTFNTFEEILQIAAAEEVDFILLGGDLFHHARPSPYCIYKCTELLRKYCLGDKPVEIEFLSDPSHSFRHLTSPIVNYEDPNLNVSIPVFSIHGNHDDPTGQKQISAMDLLSTSGLVNYFGRWNSHDMVEIEPILLKKGQTKLALYGLSHIKDERLGRLFLDRKVKMIKLTTGDQDEWFNLLVWHQNRATRGVKNFIPDDSLPKFLDLVIWGHEHDCRIDIERKTNDVHVSQPGSTVATSLTPGEAIPKHIGILKVHKRQFSIHKIELKSVRPFIFDELVLKHLNEMDTDDSNLTPSELTMQIVTDKINSMINEAKNLGRTGRASEKPLIRLNVKYKDERQVFNTIRFGQSYIGRVANPEDMVKCQAIKQPFRRQNNHSGDVFDVSDVVADRVEDIVLKHFSENDTLKCFPVDSINEAVKKYIDSNDTEAPILISDHLIKETVQKLEEKMPDIEEIDTFVENLKLIKQQNSANFVNNILNDPDRPRKRHNISSEQDDDTDVVLIDDDDETFENTTTSKKPVAIITRRGRGGSGSRGGRKGGRGRAN